MTSAASTSSRTALSGDASGSRRSPGSTFQIAPGRPSRPRRLVLTRARGLVRPALDRIVSLRRARPAQARGAGARAVHARPPRVPARRVLGAGLASPPPAERVPRAAAAVARGFVRLVARRGAEGDAGEQAGTARRTVSLRGAPAMVPGPGTTGHAACPGLVRRIADLAIVTAPAGALHVAGLAGAFAAAATVADGMVRVAARALALARRRVAGHADRAVTRPAARAFPRRTAHPELRGRRLRAQAAAAALVGATGSTVGLAATRERVAVSAQGQYDGGEEERTACEVFHRAPPGPRASNAGLFAASRTRGRMGQSHRRWSCVKRFSGTRSSHAAARDSSCGWRTPQPSHRQRAVPAGQGRPGPGRSADPAAQRVWTQACTTFDHSYW